MSRRKKNKAIPFLALTAFLALLTGIGMVAIGALGGTVSVKMEKLRSADRVLCYVVDRHDGPRFQLSGEERVIKIITHATFVSDGQYDPTKTTSYGLHVRLRVGEKTIWQEEVFTESRQSKADRLGNLWRLENAFSLDPSIQVMDDRTTIIHLPDTYPPDAMLDLRLVGEAERVLARIYQQVERSPFRREVIARALHLGDSAEEERSSTYLPWQFVPLREQMNRVRYTYDRMSAQGDRDVHYKVESIHYTGFRLPSSALSEHGTFDVNPSKAAAINLTGPGTFDVTFSTPPRTTTPSNLPITMAIRRTSTNPEETSHAVSFHSGQSLQRTFDVPAGVHTFTFQNNGPSVARILVREKSALGFGLPPPPLADHGQGVPIQRTLRPDTRRSQTYTVQEASPPLNVQVEPLQDLFARTLRIDIRLPLAKLPPDAPPTTTLRVEFRDADGKTLATHENKIESQFTPFESLEMVRIEHTDSPMGVRPLRYEMGVTDPVGLRVVMPPETRSFHVSAKELAAVTLYSYLPSEDLFEEPYQSVTWPDLHWRYAPLERRHWLPIRPDGAEELSTTGRFATLLSQVRLEPLRDNQGPGWRDFTALDPRGRPERQQIFEPTTKGHRSLVSRWTPAMVTRMQEGQTQGFSVAHGLGRRALFYYAVANDALGARLAIYDGDEEIGALVVDRTRGTVKLPALPPGDHNLKVTLLKNQTAMATSQSEFFVDLPPLRPAPLFHLRTVYALGAKPLRLQISRRNDEDALINAIVYGTVPGKDILVRTVIDGGHPRRLARPTAHLTVPDQVRSPDAPTNHRLAHFSTQRGIAGRPHRLGIFIGNDLAGATHNIEVSTPAPAALWARFFVSKRGAEPDESALQFSLGEDLNWGHGDESP